MNKMITAYMSNEIDIRDGLPEVMFHDIDGVLKIGHYFGKNPVVTPDSEFPVMCLMVITPTGDIVSRVPSMVKFVHNRLGSFTVKHEIPIDNSHEIDDDFDFGINVE